jgi:thiaminase
MLDSLTATYKTASLWELAFWEMSWTGAGWPAVRGDS